jgi:1-deoxyxylulose-5-phosphate synthase
MTADSFRNAFQPRRQLGSTKFEATVLGIGDIADRNVPIETCVATVRRAMDAGLNVIDTAPGYEDGYSEEIVGQALVGRRDAMFVIDKIDHYDQPVMPQIDASLARLNIESVDLFVLHGCSTIECWAQAIQPGGAMDQLHNARRAGKLRYRGISSHDPDVLRQAILSSLCDIVMFPIGAGCDARYMTEILPLAKQCRVGTVCFKTFGAGKLLGDTPGYNQPLRDRPRGKISSGGGDLEEGPVLPHMKVADCLHYTLTYDPDVALLGLSFPNEQDAAFQAALDFKPLSSERITQLRLEALEALQEKGPCWWNPEPLAHVKE